MSQRKLSIQPFVMVLSILLVSFIQACSSTGPVFEDPLRTIKVRVPCEYFSLTIQDQREFISESPIVINSVSRLGDEDVAHPPLPENLEGELINVLAKAQSKGKLHIGLKVEVVEAKETFFNDGVSEFEHAQVTLNISAENQADGALIDEVTVTSWGEKSRLDVSQQSIDRLLHKTFQHAFKLGLKEMKYR